MRVLIICLIIFIASCFKEDSEPLTLEEKLVGVWEFRESFDISTYLDTLWHTIEPPYPLLILNEDRTYQDEVYSKEEIGTFEVDTIDRVIGIRFTSRIRYGWVILDCDEKELTVLLGAGIEGPMKRRYFKKE